MSNDLLKSSLENASFNIIFQILCRCVTFVLNAFVVRHVGHAVLGVMNVRLLLLESMIMFLSKEPFMKACLTNTAEHNWAQVINLLWMTVPVCVLMSGLFSYIWLHLLSTAEALPQYYVFAVWAVALSCIIDLFSLPVQLVCSSFLFVKLKVVLDSIMIAIRTATFVPIILYQPENALLAFGVAQLVAAVFYTLSHYAYFYHYLRNMTKRKLRRRLSVDNSQDKFVVSESEFPFKSIQDFLPGQLENKDFVIDKKLTILTWSFFRQSILKQILTEGERLIMTFLPVLPFSEQGTYEIVNNLGSLAARFVFRPIEDSSYFYFTQMVKRDEAINEQHSVKIQESVSVLTHLCSVVTSIGLVIFVFGISYSSTLLWIYGGDKLTEPLAIGLMRAHCISVFLLGVNGVTEGYTSATADSATINKSNLTMVYESIAFLISSYVFAKWFGPVGFIFGNCINMLLRIFHSTKFINKRHLNTNHKPLLGLVPKFFFSVALIVAAITTTISQAYFFPDGKFTHIFIGAVMFAIVLLAWTYENRELITLAIKKWKDRRNRKKKSE